MIICSLTCLQNREKFAVKTIHSLLTQTIKPDKIIVYYQGSSCNYLKNIESDILNIVYISDKYRSYSKFLYCLSDYKNDIIILCDDDIIYRQEYIEKLLIAHKENNKDLICNCYRIFRYKDGIIGPMSKPLVEKKISKWLCPFSGWGTLIPPNFYNNTKILECDDFFQLVPTHDELWLFVNTLLTGRNIYCHGLYEGEFKNAISLDHRYYNNSLCKVNTHDLEKNYGKVCADFLTRNGFNYAEN